MARPACRRRIPRAAWISKGLPRPSPSPLPLASLPRLREVIPTALWWATVAVTAIRAAAGALTYLLAFAIKRGGDRWIFAAGLLIAGVGSLLATFAAPRLHRRLQPDAVLVLAILVPAFVTAVGVVTMLTGFALQALKGILTRLWATVRLLTGALFVMVAASGALAVSAGILLIR